MASPESQVNTAATRQKYWRWYRVVAVAPLIPSSVFMAICHLLVITPAGSTMLWCASVLFFILWTAWAVPLLDDPPFISVREPPQKMLRWLKFNARFPIYSSVPWVSGVVMWLIVAPWMNRPLTWVSLSVAVINLLASLLCLTLSCLISRFVFRRVEPRFRRHIRELQLCFTCGYDLRGSPGSSCPECGAAIGSHDETAQASPGAADRP